MARTEYPPRTLVPALASGVLLCLAFPGFDLSILGFLGLIPLVTSLMRPGRGPSPLVLGMVTGMVFYLGTLYWVTLTMENYGNIPRLVSLLILLLFTLYLSLYTGVFAWGVAHMARARLPVTAGAPLLWVALEYARAHLLTGFPWVLLGYSQYRHPLMIQVADLTGVYGVSFLLVLINAACVEIPLLLRRPQSRLRAAGIFAAVLVGLASVLAYGAYRTAQYRAGGSGSVLRAGVVQGNIPQEKKWDPGFRDRILATYAGLSRRVAQENPDLIVWPEASVPFFFRVETDEQLQLLELIDELGTDLLFGSADYVAGDAGGRYFNSTFLVGPGGRLGGKYDKIHLVPFGEYVPLRRALFFVRPLIEQIGDMTPGRGVTLLQTAKGPCGTPICFEIIFPDLVRRFVKAGAVFITTVTNDDWFGRSSAPYQHFSMAVFRAVENRVPVVRAANSGVSGVIAADGRILRRTPIFVEEAFTQTVTLPGGGLTFYTRFGDLFAWFCIGGAAAFLLFAAVRRVGGRSDSQAVELDQL